MRNGYNEQKKMWKKKKKQNKKKTEAIKLQN